MTKANRRGRLAGLGDVFKTGLKLGDDTAARVMDRPAGPEAGRFFALSIRAPVGPRR
jgi:hypothetical protein